MLPSIGRPSLQHSGYASLLLRCESLLDPCCASYCWVLSTKRGGSATLLHAAAALQCSSALMKVSETDWLRYLFAGGGAGRYLVHIYIVALMLTCTGNKIIPVIRMLSSPSISSGFYPAYLWCLCMCPIIENMECRTNCEVPKPNRGENAAGCGACGRRIVVELHSGLLLAMEGCSMIIEDSARLAGGVLLNRR